MIMHVGFTGTQRGMTKKQKKVFDIIVRGASSFHHGDCIGADAQAHKRVPNSIVHIHPPENPAKRAWCEAPHIHQPKPYLVRNRIIVGSTEMLIATPGEMEEVVRSGTWATIRFARKMKKKVIIIYPNGKLGQ